jgi:hypothetical protein
MLWKMFIVVLLAAVALSAPAWGQASTFHEWIKITATITRGDEKQLIPETIVAGPGPFMNADGSSGTFSGTVTTAGGVIPTITMSGGTNLHAWRVEGRISYAFAAVPLSTAPPSVPVPVIIEGSGSISIGVGTIASGSVGGSMNLRIFNGVTQEEAVVTSVSCDNFGCRRSDFSPGEDDSFMYSEIVSILGAGRITMDTFVSGTLPPGNDVAPTWSVFMDPKVFIDPNATFDLNGTLTRYADAYELQFSDFVEPFDPEVPTLDRTWGSLKSLYGSQR